MEQVIDIVKRSGKRPSERFDSKKLHRSVHAACLSVRCPEAVADTTADSICSAVIIWCQTRPEITSHDIRRIASHHLKKIQPDAAYLYQHHRLVI